MKTTYKPRPKKIAWSEANKESCRKMKWKNASDVDGGRRSDAQRPCGPAPTKASVPSRETARQSAVFRPVTKWTNYTTDLITRSSPLMIQTMRGNAQKSSSSLLPPIRGSRIPSSAVIAAVPFISKAPTVHHEDTNAKLLTSMTKENALFRLYLTNQGKPSNFKSRLINGNVVQAVAGEGARAKNRLVSVRCQPIKSVEEQRSCAINTGSRDCEAGMCALKHASGRKEPSSDVEAGPHYDLDRDEWTETDVLRCLQSGDYYTDQRISEWILNVNASLFCPSSGSVGSIGPSEEQDTSIKIVYDRE